MRAKRFIPGGELYLHLRLFLAHCVEKDWFATPSSMLNAANGSIKNARGYEEVCY